MEYKVIRDIILWLNQIYLQQIGALIKKKSPLFNGEKSNRI